MNSKQILHNCLEQYTITTFEDNYIEFNKALRQEQKLGLDIEQVKKQYNLYLQICHQLLCVINYLKKPFSQYKKDIFHDLIDMAQPTIEQQHNILTAIQSVCQILVEFQQDLDVDREKGLISDSDNCFLLLLSKYDCAQYLGVQEYSQAQPEMHENDSPQANQ